MGFILFGKLHSLAISRSCPVFAYWTAAKKLVRASKAAPASNRHFSSTPTLPLVARPADIPARGLTLYVVKASPTSYVNVVKPLILIEELHLPHTVYVVPDTDINAHRGWFERLNPGRMVPTLEDDVPIDELASPAHHHYPGPHDDRRVHLSRRTLWESTSCLQFLGDKYDATGRFRGCSLADRAEVGNWLALHTAGLGATAKWWLWFKTKQPENMVTLARLSSSIEAQYTILDIRLSGASGGASGQDYLALSDRPTLADIATLPFANATIAATAGFDDFSRRWRALGNWSERMLARPAVRMAYARARTFGLDGKNGVVDEHGGGSDDRTTSKK